MAKANVEAIKKAKDGLDVWDDILRYAETGYETIDPDDMLRFRWYGIYEQIPKNGHFMMRVKIPGGNMTADQLRAVAEVTRDYARDIADVTTRQNFQFHWLTVKDLPPVIEILNRAGLTTSGACGDITRNICGSPIAGVNPTELIDERPLVEAVTKYFLNNKEFSDLPRKYKMCITGESNPSTQPEINDVGFYAVTREVNGEKEVGFHVRVGGGLSSQPHLSQKLNIFVKPEQVVDVARGITEIFRDDGYRKSRAHSRLKFLVADWGAEKFLEVLIQHLGWTPDPAVEWQEPSSLDYPNYTGVHAQKQPGKYWICVSVITGRVNSTQLYKAAEISEKYCEGSIRTTHNQNIIFPNIDEANLPEVKAALREAGFEWEVSEFKRGGVSCTGTEFCNLALTETKGRLKEVVAHLESKLLWDDPIRIHITGCPNSCGQHYIGDVGLYGCKARLKDGTQVEAYDVCLGGRLGSDAKFVRAIGKKIPATLVKYAVENVLRKYKELKSGGETFGQFVDRHSNDELGEYLGLDLIAQDDPTWAPPPPRAHAPAGAE